jgi:molecular chaperone Hsp33
VTDDHLCRYMLASGTVRIETVRIETAWQSIRQGRGHPPNVERLLGEMVAACALLSANLKFDGSVVLQIQGDGPVRLAVAECFADLGVRATIKVDEGTDVYPDSDDLQALVNPGGRGRCIVILDPKTRGPQRAPYQGVVPLEGTRLALAIEHYMLHSEQLETRLWLAADAERITGVLLQRLPKSGGTIATEGDASSAASADEHLEDWQRLCILTDTLTDEELLTTAPGDLINRLFWEESIRMFDPQPLRFHCTCSRQKVADMLRMLGEAELDATLAEQGKVDVKCDYCAQRFVFDAVDARSLFHGDTSLPSSRALH